MGFNHSKADSSLFYFVSATKILLILIYVDNIIITANKMEFLTQFTTRLHRCFALRDLGPLHFFLGIQVTRDSIGFLLSQSKYAQDLLENFSMGNINSCPTPMAINVSLSATEGNLFQHPTSYRSAIDGLQYLTYTRPDLSFAVNKLSQYLQQPTDLH